MTNEVRITHASNSFENYFDIPWLENHVGVSHYAGQRETLGVGCSQPNPTATAPLEQDPVRQPDAITIQVVTQRARQFVYVYYVDYDTINHHLEAWESDKSSLSLESLLEPELDSFDSQSDFGK